MAPLFKNTYREILRSPGRFLAIIAIIVLGSGFFVGLRVSQKAMTATADTYFSDTGFYDFSVTTTLGLDSDSVEAIASDPNVLAAEGAFETDALVTLGGSDTVYSFHSLPSVINTPALIEGRMPQSPDECLADGWTGVKVGDTVTLSDANDQGTLELFTRRSFTVTGIANSPLYLNFERGSTDLGSGSVSAFCYVPMSAFDADYYTCVYIRCYHMPAAYTGAYDARADELEPAITRLADAQALARYDRVLSDGRAELDDARAEYDSALEDYRTQRADAEAELQDAWAELQDAKAELQDASAEIQDAQAELDDGWRELRDREPELRDARAELDDAKAELDSAKAELDDGWAKYYEALEEFNSKKAEGEGELDSARQELADALEELNYGEAEYSENLALYEEAEAQFRSGLSDYNDAKASLDQGEREYDAGLAEYNSSLSSFEEGKAALEAQAGQVEELRGAVSTYDSLTGALLGAVNSSLPDGAKFSDTSGLMSALASGADPALNAAVNGVLAGAAGIPGAPGDVDSLLEMDSQMSGYRSAVSDYDSATAALPEAQRQLDEARDALAGARSELDAGWEEFEPARRQVSEARAELRQAKKELDDGRAKLDEGRKEYEEGLREYESSASQFASSIAEAQAQLDDSYAELSDAQREYDDGLQKYEDGLREYEDGLRAYNDGKAELERAGADLEDARRQYSDGLREYEDGLREYEDARADAQREFDDAEAELRDAKVELDDAEADLAKLEEPDAYVLGRWGNLGYSCFESDTSIVRAISAVFPLFFFLVAALICLTTVSRMVEEQRSQLGVLLALGYSLPAVMSKFLFYSGAATVVGGVSGILLGSKLIPAVVWKAYGIMYSFSDTIRFVFDLPLSAITFSLYVVSMLAVTLVTCLRELRDVPAAIIRPKPPRSGKRVLLERVPFIWNRLSFLWKVTVRNIFRYKSRVLMMILGIAGCAALMITGMGINDSIRNVVDYQFTEISLYDYTVTFSESLTASDMEQFLSGVSGQAAETVFLDQSAMTASSNRSEKEVQLNVLPGDALEAIPRFVDFHSGASPVALPGDGQILINSGLAESLDLRAGDTVTLRLDSGETMELTVCGVYDNYIYNSVYVTRDTYASALGRDPDMNFALVIKAPGVDPGEGLAAILSQSNVLTATSSADLRQRISGMMDSLIYIVLLTIVCAAALAFVVIYNLTNINIQERLREIATVKVLGFYDPETAMYVLRENILLTLLGAAVGIPMGLALNAYVVTRIDLDMIHFVPRVHPASCLWSVALTFLFSLTVDLLMLRRLSRIDPASALKAAE